jgi:Helix-turn-helix domain
MRLPVFTWVLDHSEERLGNRLVLLALAEHAHDDGTKAYPSNATLMKRTRLSERAVRDALRALERSNAVECYETLRNGTKVYRIVGPFNVNGGSPRRGQNPPGAESGSQTAPEPSVTRQKRSSSSKRAGRAPTMIGGKRVTDDEESFALSVLAIFNAVSGKRFGSKEALGKIILRHREHPDLAAEDHERIIREQFERPWWSGDPSPAVIYGNGEVFDRALNGVRGGDSVRQNGQDSGNEARRYTRD